ncbi:MAG: hypothetical protein ABUL60_17490 [Myxococcales bacterium]
MTAESLAPPSMAGCEVLFELLHGPHGTVHLGRMLRGIDTGRLVMLREIANVDAPVLAAVDLARSLAHPQLLKSLGVVHGATAHYLASEYVPGLSLLELEANVRKSHFPLRPGVAVRIVKDALRAAAVAQRLLHDTAALSYVRCLFADTVWIAEFGDVLLTDVLVAPLLGKPADADPGKAAAKDLLAAAIHLFQLASGEPLSPSIATKLGAYVPELLAETLGRALGVDQSTPFASIEELVQALDQLPKELQANERDVSEEIQRRVGANLAQRRNKLGLLELGAAKQESDDVTRVFRPVLPEKVNPDTVRPQAAADAPPVPELPKPPKVDGKSSWQDEPTRVDRPAAGLTRTSDHPVSNAPTARKPSVPPSNGRPRVTPAPRSSVRPLVSSVPSHSRKSRMLWLVGLGLLATLSAAWWAASEHRLGVPPLLH